MPSYPELDLLDDRSPEGAADPVEWAAVLADDLDRAVRLILMLRRHTKADGPRATDDAKQAGSDIIRIKPGLLGQQLKGRSRNTPHDGGRPANRG